MRGLSPVGSLPSGLATGEAEREEMRRVAMRELARDTMVT